MLVRRAAAALSTLALGAGLMLGASTPATAGPVPAPAGADASCATPKMFFGSGGHHGASISCTGTTFQIAILCYKSSADYWYTHYGNVAGSGGTSTAWCDLYAEIKAITTV
ncbi:hypothetical protein ACWCQE_31000 [Streptomyces sp. NPDC002409]